MKATWIFEIVVLTSSGTALAGGVAKAMTKSAAEAEALKLVPGKVLEVEKEKYQGEPVFSVEIKAADGVHEVIFRIADGTLIENKVNASHEEDGDDDDD